MQLPDAASAERNARVTEHVQDICLNTPGVKHTLAVSGQSFALSATLNFGSMFVILEYFSEREKPVYAADGKRLDLTSNGIAAALNKRFAKEIPDAQVGVFPPVPVRGVGRTGGFKLMVEDRGEAGLGTLQEQADKLAATARKQMNPGSSKLPFFNFIPSPPPLPLLTVMPNVFRANVPQLYVDTTAPSA